jgi:hypothetical protein
VHHYNRLLAEAGHPEMHITGYAFRRGAVGAMIDAGVAEADVSNTAWAPGSQVPFHHYASNRAIHALRLKTSRQLQPVRGD